MPGWEQWWPWMMGMHMAWMLLPPITIVLAVVAIILAARGPRKTVASDHRSPRPPSNIRRMTAMLRAPDWWYRLMPTNILSSSSSL